MTTSNDRPAQSTVLHLDEIDSTNAEAMRRAGAGERGPLWIVADRQTAARGRSGRSWASPEGNLATSFLFEPVCRADDLHQLALLTGVAVCEAVQQTAGRTIPGLRLKWPNDLLIGSAKTGGILIETTTWGPRTVAVIGIGLNIAAAPEIDGRSVTRLGALVPALTRDVMLAALRSQMQHWLGLWRSGAGFPAIRSAWQERAGAAGEGLGIHAGAERIDGTYLGIDETGALLLRDGSGMVRRLTYGDVTLADVTGTGP